MKRVPIGAMEDWARAYSFAAQMLLDACKLLPSNPLYRVTMTRAAKWYSFLPQLILRQPGKGARDGKIVQTRLHELHTCNYKSLVVHWYTSVMRQRINKRAPPAKKTEKILKSAVDKILSGDVGRGLRRLESHGCAPCDNAAIRVQMKDKRPAPLTPVTWPVLPDGRSTSINIDLSKQSPAV